MTATSVKDGIIYPLQPVFLIVALLLLCLDTFIMLYLRRSPNLGRSPGWLSSVSGLVLCLVMVSSALVSSALVSSVWAAPVHEATMTARDTSQSTHLAFVRTGNDATDRLSLEGLQGLSRVVNARSSVDLADPVGVVLDEDDLSLFPLLYWPVRGDIPTLSAPAIAGLNRFMASGGMILFDTQSESAQYGSGGQTDSANSAALARLAARLNLPPFGSSPH